MAIRDFVLKPERKQVGHVGAPAPTEARTAFQVHGYDFEEFTDVKLTDPTTLALTDSIVFSQDATEPKRIREALQRSAALLLDYDCRIYVRVAANAPTGKRARDVIFDAIESLRLPPAWRPDEPNSVTYPPYIYVCDTGVDWFEIARLISINPAGKAPKSKEGLPIYVMDFEGKPIQIIEERQRLLRRAFADCLQLHLFEMTDGLSGAPAYRVSAWPEAVLGTYPHVYFVKLGERTTIVREYDKYIQDALKYVPYDLSVRIDRSRCSLGAREGVLVGDFADRAEVLRDCASGGRAAQVIANLFNVTLRSWHDLGTLDETRSIPDCLLDRFPEAGRMPGDRVALARQLGATQSIDQLRELFRRCATTPIRIGLIHGDLHATNVLARSNDAIIIDYEKLERGMPLLFDAASLEGGLLVEGFIRDIRRRGRDEWFTSILPLYDSCRIIDWMKICDPHEPSAWFFGCVRQIRNYARHLECQSGQYAATLGLVLARKSCNPVSFDAEREIARAAAFVLAEKVLAGAAANLPGGAAP